MLHRFSTTHESIAVVATEGASKEILYGEYTSGMVHIQAASAVTELTWYVSPKAGGTYYVAYDYNGVAVTQTVSHTKSYPIPLALIGNIAIKVVASVGATGTIDVSLKA